VHNLKDQMSGETNENLVNQVSTNSFKGSSKDGPSGSSGDSKMKRKSSRGNMLKVRSNSSRIDANM